MREVGGTESAEEGKEKTARLFIQSLRIGKLHVQFPFLLAFFFFFRFRLVSFSLSSFLLSRSRRFSFSFSCFLILLQICYLELSNLPR